MIYPEELRALARRVIWFEEPEEALKYTRRFLTYLMTYGTPEDVKVAEQYYAASEFVATLDEPAPGIFNLRSWQEWNTRYQRVPVPPLPKRVLPGERPDEVPETLFVPRRT